MEISPCNEGLLKRVPWEVREVGNQHAAIADDRLTGHGIRSGNQADDRRGDILGLADAPSGSFSANVFSAASYCAP